MARRQLKDAKQQFSRLVNLARRRGPRVVRRHGREAAAVLGIDEHRRTGSCAFKRFLAEAPDFDLLEVDRATERGPGVEP